MGEMAVESMGSLFHGFGGGGYGYERPGETVVNNYYDEPGQHEHHVDDSNFYNPSNDASRQDPNNDLSDQTSQSFTDTGNDLTNNDTGGFSGDTTNFVDNSGFDDSDSNFGGGGDGSF